jgi:hypothetical protein
VSATNIAKRCVTGGGIVFSSSWKPYHLLNKTVKALRTDKAKASQMPLSAAKIALLAWHFGTTSTLLRYSP